MSEHKESRPVLNWVKAVFGQILSHQNWKLAKPGGPATLLEGAGCLFFTVNLKVEILFVLWCFKTVKLVNFDSNVCMVPPAHPLVYRPAMVICSNWNGISTGREGVVIIFKLSCTL